MSSCRLLRLKDRTLILELVDGLSKHIEGSEDAFYLRDKLTSLTEATGAETSISTQEVSHEDETTGSHPATEIEPSLRKIQSTSRELEECFRSLTKTYSSEFHAEQARIEKEQGSQGRQSDELDTSARSNNELSKLTDRSLLEVEADMQEAAEAEPEATDDRDVDDNLLTLEKQICDKVQFNILPYVALVTDLSGQDSLDSVITALRYVSHSGKHHDLRFVLDHVPRFLKGPQFEVMRKMFEEAIDRGTRIRFVLCPKSPNIPLEEEIIVHFGELTQKLGSRGTEVLAIPHPAPNAMLLDIENRDIVIIDTFAPAHDSILRLAVDSIALSGSFNDLISHADKLQHISQK